MNISIGLLIFLSLVGVFVLYIVIETAVRRGIDTSETSKKIRELMESDHNQHKS